MSLEEVFRPDILGYYAKRETTYIEAVDMYVALSFTFGRTAVLTLSVL